MMFGDITTLLFPSINLVGCVFWDYDLYDKTFRIPFFTGFLTLSGFLFTSKIFILTHMNKEVYEQKWYRKRVEDFKKYNKNYDLYRPLKKLDFTLFLAILFCLATSIYQITLGNIHADIVSFVAFLLALVSFTFLLIGMFRIQRNIKLWISALSNGDHLDEDDEKSSK